MCVGVDVCVRACDVSVMNILSQRLLSLCGHYSYTSTSTTTTITTTTATTSTPLPPPPDRLVVKASALRAEDPGFEFFRGRVIPVTSKLVLQWLPCQAPGVIGSVLGLVGLVSV